MWFQKGRRRFNIRWKLRFPLLGFFLRELIIYLGFLVTIALSYILLFRVGCCFCINLFFSFRQISVKYNNLLYCNLFGMFLIPSIFGLFVVQASSYLYIFYFRTIHKLSTPSSLQAWLIIPSSSGPGLNPLLKLDMENNYRILTSSTWTD